MCRDKHVSIKCWLLRLYHYEMNNNWRRELTVRLFLYFVQTMTVRTEKLEIGYEQKLNEGRPYLPRASLCSPLRRQQSNYSTRNHDFSTISKLALKQTMSDYLMLQSEGKMEWKFVNKLLITYSTNYQNYLTKLT